jgi:hypothetical protein
MMRKDPDNRNLLIVDDERPMGVARWVPTAVVAGVLVGFVSLAWYAYHAGMQSMKEEDLLVVEADKTPMKEKPADPGGMQFPNQDKTIFETFANNQQPAKVERVLPTPEEPLPKDGAKIPEDMETTTWVNDKKDPGTGKEQMIGGEKKVPIPPIPVDTAPDHQVIAPSVTYVAPKPAAALDNAVKAPDKPSEKPIVIAPAAKDEKGPAVVAVPVQEKKVEKSPEKLAEKAPEKLPEKPKPAPKPEKPVAADTGAAKIQLGAYRSEKEAQDAWGKIQGKFSALSGKSPTIVKADLGERGIYYRLRVGGYALSEAKSTCAALSAKGQACILPTEK